MNTKHHYLRLLRTFALAALTAAAAAACSDDTDNDREPLTPPDGADGIPVTFTADINPGSDADPAAAPGTRTILTPAGGGFTVEWKGQDTYPDACDWIGIWAVKDNRLTSESSKDYVPTTSGVSSALVPEDVQNPLTVPSAGDWTFRAVYGENGAGNGRASAVLSPLSQSAPGDTKHIARFDFSVATTPQHILDAGSEMPQSINLKFEHKLSALQLHVTNQSGEALTVKEIRLSAAGGQIAYLKAYHVATGGWKADEELKSDYLQLKITTPAALPSDGTAQDFHMLLFPGYAGTDMTITVITDRGEYTLTKTAPGTGFAAGHNYMTNITIKTSGLDPDKETWTETISNKAELAAFRDRVNGGNKYDGATIRLTADIDLANETWTTPIGYEYGKRFSGTFDGGGYHISNLTVDYGSNAYAGLFGYVYKGTVRNLRVSGTVTTTGYHAGGIAGYLSGSTVENCIFDGDVSGAGNVGGIAGYSLETSRIAGCHTKGKVTATAIFSRNAGGIAGYNVKSTIDGCYSEAEVKTSNQTAGGIAGTNEGGGTITHCYATGKVSGKGYVGGIVGNQYDGTLTGCIALNPGLTRTEGSETDFGRIVGLNQGTSPVNSCGAYDGMTIKDASNTDIIGGATGEHGTALPAAQCLTAVTYTTTHGFPEATAATPGWAFGAATPWTYLPWNKAFESFPGISETDYRISVPAHLNASVIP